MSAPPLQGWKAIADYLDCSVKTAQNWEKERGLPIRRPPGGGRPMVVALREELDEWLLGDRPEATVTEPPRSPLGSGAVGWILISVILAIVAAFATWSWSRSSGPPEVAEIRYERSYANEGIGRIVTLNAIDGRRLRTLAFDNVVATATLAPGDPPTLLVGFAQGDAEHRGHVVRMDLRGRELWSTDVYDEEAMAEYDANGYPHSGYLEPQFLDVAEVDGRPVVSVVTHDETWSASAVALFDFESGEPLAAWWHPGKVGYGETLVGDPDQDGRRELIVWGHNNALRGWLAEEPDGLTTVVFAIEPEQILRWGTAQAWPPRWNDRPATLPDWYLFLPRPPDGSPNVASLAFEDRDRDGRDDIVVVTDDNAFYYVTATGDLITADGGDDWRARYPSRDRPSDPIRISPLHLALSSCWTSGIEAAEPYFAEAVAGEAAPSARDWVDRCRRLLPTEAREPALPVEVPLLSGVVRVGGSRPEDEVGAPDLVESAVVVELEGRAPRHALDLLFAFYDRSRSEPLEVVVEREGRRERVALPTPSRARSAR